MKGKAYSEELKQQILREVEETGNISLVARNHSIAPTTISGWMKPRDASRSRGPRTSDFNSTNHIKEVEKENDKLKKILGQKDLEIAILKDLLKKNEPSIKDKVEVARKYIDDGYKASIVLKIVGLSRSTYYYHISKEYHITHRAYSSGRPNVGYHMPLKEV